MKEITILTNQFAKDKIRKQILSLVQDYAALEFAPKKFVIFTKCGTKAVGIFSGGSIGSKVESYVYGVEHYHFILSKLCRLKRHC